MNQQNNIVALVEVLSTRSKTKEPSKDRRLSKYEEHGDGRIAITSMLKGEAPAPKKKPLAISYERCPVEHIRYKKGTKLQVEGVIEPLTKSEDIFYALRVCVSTEAGERALSLAKNISAQDERNELIRSDKAFMLADEGADIVPKSRQDLSSLHDFLYSHGLCYDVEMAYFIDSYFKRRWNHRSSGKYNSVSAMVQDNPLVLSELYPMEKNFSSYKLIQALHLQPSEKARIYAKAVLHIILAASYGDTFVPMSKLYGILHDDLKDKPKDFLHDVLMDMTGSDPFIRSMAKLNFFSPKKLFVGMSAKISSYYEEKLNEERPEDAERNERTARFLFEKPAFYLTKNFFSEKNVAKYLATRLGEEDAPILATNIQEKFTDEQKNAVKRAFQYKTSIVTGSAGCGKTAVVAEIVRIAKENGKSVIVLAPSAKAALHAAVEVSNQQAISIPYQTIHRFAKILPEDADAGEQGDFLPLDDAMHFDFVIIDEMSLCELKVFNRVLKVLTLTPKTHLILVGDPMQLPAIGPQFFHQLADGLLGDILPVSHLTKNFRAKSDALAKFSEEIRAGKFAIPDATTISFEESTLKEFIEDHEMLLADEDTMFLAARKDDVERLNSAIRSIRNPNAQPIPPTRFYIGDRVITDCNDYAESTMKKPSSDVRHPDRNVDIYNGTDGILESYDEATDTAIVRMFSPDFPKEGKCIPYRKRELGLYLKPAFAITVNKAQGSQFLRAVFFLPEQKYGNISRNLLYTAITRAEKELCLVGKQEQYEAATKKMAHFGNSFLAFRTLQELKALQEAAEEEEVVFSI